MIFAIVALLAIATPEPLPAGYTCEDVRRVIAEQGKVKAVAWAIRQGLSIQQIYVIRRTCKV